MLSLLCLCLDGKLFSLHSRNASNVEAHPFCFSRSHTLSQFHSFLLSQDGVHNTFLLFFSISFTCCSMPCPVSCAIELLRVAWATGGSGIGLHECNKQSAYHARLTRWGICQ